MSGTTTRNTIPWYMNSGDLHRGGLAPFASSPAPLLPLLKGASSEEGLAGSMGGGGVLEEVVSLVSRVSRE